MLVIYYSILFVALEYFTGSCVVADSQNVFKIKLGTSVFDIYRKMIKLAVSKLLRGPAIFPEKV